MNPYTEGHDSMCRHVDQHWTCESCQRHQCERCDGIPDDSGLCWACFTTEPDHETGAAA